MKIGEVARDTGTKITTIRFYEGIGLLHAPLRSNTGRRLYARADVERLNFIRNGRRLGFSIDEIRSLLALSDQPDRDCREVARIAAEHLTAVEERIAQLCNLRDELSAISGGTCESRMADCRVIHAIASKH